MLSDDLKKSLESARKATEGLRLPNETIEQLERINKLGRLISASAPRRRLLPPQLRGTHAVGGPERGSPLRTQRAVEALLTEAQAGAERERRMLRLTRINIGVALASAGLAAVGIVLVAVVN
jgi:hypothetical protein